MNIVDLVALALVCTGLVLGVRSGAVPQVLGLVGAGIGIALIFVLAPAARELLGGLDQPVRALAGVGGVFLVVGLGEAAGSAAGRHLRGRYVGDTAAMIDGALGGVVGVAQAIVVIWIAGGLLAAAPVPDLARQAQRSIAVRTVSRLLPPPTAITGDLVRIIGSSGLPQLFLGLEPPPALPVGVPSRATAELLVRAARASTVRIEGTACGSIVTGTGFVVAHEYVVTSAHVVAGATQVVVTVDADPGAQGYGGLTVLFDPWLDIALLRVRGLSSPPLAFADSDPGRGVQGAALGHPDGRPLTVIPAAVTATYHASGRDLYGERLVDRTVIELRAAIEPGDSGGPVVLSNGTVGGVVFAESRADPNVGYALTPTVVRATVVPSIGRATGVSTGPCIR